MKIDMKHAWVMKEGVIDMDAVENDTHSGPICDRCYECFCRFCMSVEEADTLLDSECDDDKNPNQLELIWNED